jgi:hypothetical protein
LPGRRLSLVAALAVVLAACQSQATPPPLAIGPTLVPGEIETLEPDPTEPPNPAPVPQVLNTILDHVTSVVLLADGRIVVGGSVGGRAAVAYHDGGAWIAVGVPGPVVWSLAATGGLELKASTCQASGPAGLCATMIATSKDGGAAWTLAPGPPIVTEPDVQTTVELSFGDADRGWAFEPAAGIDAAPFFATNDGGTTWQRIAAPCEGWALVAMARASKTIGWIGCADEPGAGQEPKSVRLTTDGGATWRTMARADPISNGNIGQIDGSGYLNGLAGIPDGHVWSWYGRGGLAGSSDGGATWAGLGLGSPDVSEVISASLIDANAGVALLDDSDTNSDELVQTTDGGRTWQLVTRFPRG